jgi:predicted aspartyl protease
VEPRRDRRAGLAGLAWLTIVVAAAGPASAQLYQWTDAEGVVRYTNDLATIPPAYRAGARDVGSPQPRAPEPRSTVESTVIPFAAGGPILAAVSLNGTPLTLMLDTGAERTLIAPAALARAGLDAARGREVRILGVTGSAAAHEVLVERLDLGGTRVGPLAVIAHDVGAGGVDGLLGRDVLDAFTLNIDAAAGRAVLTPR